METLRIVGLSVLAACLYGIAHDQITARVCVEYFTIGHPFVFPTDSPTLLGLGWGVLATWWFGLAMSVPLAACARLGRLPKLSASSLVKPLAILLLVMSVTAFLSGLTGFFLARREAVWLLEPMASRIPASLHPRFIADLWAHLASYGSGFIGGTVVCILIVLKRRNAHISSTDVTL